MRPNPTLVAAIATILSTKLAEEQKRVAFDEAACRASCDICFDEVGQEWPCAKERAMSRANAKPTGDHHG